MGSFVPSMVPALGDLDSRNGYNSPQEGFL